MSRVPRPGAAYGRRFRGPAMPQWLVTRRRALTLAAAASAMPLLPRAFAAKPGPGAKFFTAEEFSTLERIADMIVPADDVSAGAREARVAQIIDARIGESVEPALRREWRGHLAEIDRLSLASFGSSLLGASGAQCVRLLERISRNEDDPKNEAEYAFGTIKWEVCDVYYRSKIGIHDDLKYQGNRIQDEFTGTDVADRPALPSLLNQPREVGK